MLRSALKTAFVRPARRMEARRRASSFHTAETLAPRLVLSAVTAVSAVVDPSGNVEATAESESEHDYPTADGIYPEESTNVTAVSQAGTITSANLTDPPQETTIADLFATPGVIPQQAIATNNEDSAATEFVSEQPTSSNTDISTRSTSLEFVGRNSAEANQESLTGLEIIVEALAGRQPDVTDDLSDDIPTTETTDVRRYDEANNGNEAEVAKQDDNIPVVASEAMDDFFASPFLGAPLKSLTPTALAAQAQ